MSNRQVHRQPDLPVHSRGDQHSRVQRTEWLSNLVPERGSSNGSNTHRRSGWQCTGRHEHHPAGADAQSVEKSGRLSEGLMV